MAPFGLLPSRLAVVPVFSPFLRSIRSPFKDAAWVRTPNFRRVPIFPILHAPLFCSHTRANKGGTLSTVCAPTHEFQPLQASSYFISP